ncbi:MAG: hypothetical protein HOF19_04685 [Gammaproteobacteria bacterium]|jgi:hypothetical protein|nr:hypothetical protein [Gammaproteobacteria bacterium]MBT5443334.1 hypothetical protein [Gammaproteobacteria bacterium]MBT6569426.1 hypothetical protein [Gammaproteobacteria bacterium]MBT6951550.1 hypothetical protein [Gammaproteobacteria bacterium]
MASLSEIDENRRRFLLHLLASAAFTTTAGCSISSTGLTSELPAGRSIQALTGDVHVNGVPASVLTLINPGDIIETFDRSFVVFVVQKDAFILRSNSIMTLPGRTATPGIISTAFTLERGKALSVLASRRTDISTPNAVIGVRGTGVYVEAEPDLSYVCVCYGTSDVTTRDNPGITETIVSDHHTAPRYILADKSASQRIIPAPFKNHDDQELLLIETLVGRTPPFIVPRGVTRTRGSYL